MPSKSGHVLMAKRASAQPLRRSSPQALSKSTPATALASAAGGSDVFLKSIGKEIGKGALAALGGFAVNAILGAITGDPGQEQLEKIGRQLDQISAQLARIETSLKELVAVTNQILATLQEILKEQKKAALKDLQGIFARIDTYHLQLAEYAGDIDEHGKSRVTPSALKKNVEQLIADMKSSRARPSLREEFTRLDSILFGSAELTGMIDVVIEILRADVRSGTLILPNAMDRIENFVRWAAWGQYRALRLLINIEVRERADPAVPTATETALLKEMTARLDRLSDRVVAFAETMADERDRNNEFFGGLEPSVLHQEPAHGPWKQYTNSVISRADRLRETLLGQTNVVVRLIPHLPNLPLVHRRGAEGHDPGLAEAFLKDYFEKGAPRPVMQVRVGTAEISATPRGPFRAVAANGLVIQNPPITHGLHFFAYEIDVDDRLPGKGEVGFETSLHPASEAAVPAYQYSVFDRTPVPVLPPISGRVSRAGGASVTGMTYATVTGGSTALPRFRLLNMQFPGQALTVDVEKQRAKMTTLNLQDPHQLWFMEPQPSALGLREFRLLNVGTGLCCCHRQGDLNPIEALTPQEVGKLEDRARWVLGDVHASGEHYPLQCRTNRTQMMSALVSDTPIKKQRRPRERYYRLGTDGLQTLSVTPLGAGGHLFWKFDVLLGKNVKPWEPVAG
jgi:hypothetical protein